MSIKKLISKFHRFLLKYGQFIQNIINFILLIPVYFIGVLVAKLIFKKKTSNVGWLNCEKEINEYRMF